MSETKKYFTLSNSNDDQITSRTDLDIFINPDEHDPHEISLLMKQVIAYVQESGKKVWPLDPIAIKYFEKHPELNNIWYHRPFTK